MVHSKFINPEKYSPEIYEKCRDFSSLEEVLDFVKGVQNGKIPGMDYGLWSIMYTGRKRPNGDEEVKFRIKWPAIGKKFVDILKIIPNDAFIIFEDIISARSLEEDQGILEYLTTVPYLTTSLSFEAMDIYKLYFSDRTECPLGDDFSIYYLKRIGKEEKENLKKRFKDYNIPFKEDFNSLKAETEMIELPGFLRKRRIIDDCTKKNIINLCVDLYSEAYEKRKEGHWEGKLFHPIYTINYGRKIPHLVKESPEKVIDALINVYNIFGGEGSPLYFEVMWKGPFYEVEITNNAGHVTKEISITSPFSEIDKALEEVLG